MSRGINRVTLIGNLGADPEVRYTPEGTAITTIRVATSEVWKDRKTGEAKAQTEWHRVVFFNALAEIVAKYLKKGGKVYIEGKLRTRKWQDKTGQERYTTEILGHEMQMLDGRTADKPHDGSEVLVSELPVAEEQASLLGTALGEDDIPY